MVMGIGSLSAAARRNYSIIQQGVAQGLPSKAINDAIRAGTGAGIRRSDLLQGMRVAGGVQQAGRNIGNVGLNRRPNYATLPAFTPVTSDKKYLVQYEVRWKDSVTGASGSNFITIGTDQTLTRLELDLAAVEAWVEGQSIENYGENRDIERLVPIGARQQII
jgi:hypothetical protein